VATYDFNDRAGQYDKPISPNHDQDSELNDRFDTQSESSN